MLLLFVSCNWMPLSCLYDFKETMEALRSSAGVQTTMEATMKKRMIDFLANIDILIKKVNKNKNNLT